MPATRHALRLARTRRRRLADLAARVPLLLLVAGVTCSVALALRWNAEVQERTRIDFDDAGEGVTRRDRRRGGPLRGRAARPARLRLTIARSLVEAHGGTLSVESEVGTGTAFAVALPLAEIAQVSAPARVVDC